jgi:hypothetical protein
VPLSSEIPGYAFGASLLSVVNCAVPTWMTNLVRPVLIEIPGGSAPLLRRGWMLREPGKPSRACFFVASGPEGLF